MCTVAVLTGLSIFAACNLDLTKLPKPANPRIDNSGTFFTWDEVLSNNGYIVQVNDDPTVREVTGNFWELSNLTYAGEYRLKVKAKGDNANYSDSDWSQIVTYTVPVS